MAVSELFFVEPGVKVSGEQPANSTDRTDVTCY